MRSIPEDRVNALLFRLYRATQPSTNPQPGDSFNSTDVNVCFQLTKDAITLLVVRCEQLQDDYDASVID